MNREEFSICKFKKDYLIWIVSENEIDTRIMKKNNIYDHNDSESSKSNNLRYYKNDHLQDYF